MQYISIYTFEDLCVQDTLNNIKLQKKITKRFFFMLDDTYRMQISKVKFNERKMYIEQKFLKITI